MGAQGTKYFRTSFSFSYRVRNRFRVAIINTVDDYLFDNNHEPLYLNESSEHDIEYNSIDKSSELDSDHNFDQQKLRYFNFLLLFSLLP